MGFSWAILHTRGTWNGFGDEVSIIGISVAGGLLIGFLNNWEYIRKGIQAGAVAYEGEVWNCTITPTHWTYTDRKGVGVSIPWALMSIEFETDDAWLVQYENAQVVVYRKPLRDAGLEGNFQEAIRGSHSTGKVV